MKTTVLMVTVNGISGCSINYIYKTDSLKGNMLKEYQLFNFNGVPWWGSAYL